MAAVISLLAQSAVAQPAPTREYVRLGGRVIAIENAAVAVALTPASPQVLSGSQVQFTATVTGATNTAVTWSVASGGGTITNSGLYTAPTVTSTTTATVRATSQAFPSSYASATVTINPDVSVSVSPSSPSISSGGQVQFTATVTGATNTAVTWSVVSGGGTGTIDEFGLYRAPSVTSTITATVQAASQAYPSSHASVTFDVNPNVTVSISPLSPSVLSGGQVQFTATVTGATNTAVTWSVVSGGGTITPSGLYTAPTVTSTTT